MSHYTIIQKIERGWTVSVYRDGLTQSEAVYGESEEDIMKLGEHVANFIGKSQKRHEPQAEGSAK